MGSVVEKAGVDGFESGGRCHHAPLIDPEMVKHQSVVVDLHLYALPLVGESIACDGNPRHHRTPQEVVYARHLRHASFAAGGCRFPDHGGRSGG